MSGGGERRAEIDNALTTGAVLLAAMYLIARAAANQFSPYSGETAFAGLVAVLLGICVGLKAFLSPKPVVLPSSLALLSVIWSALFIFAALRSPNPGMGIPLAGDAGIYLLLLLAGYLLCASNGALVELFVRATVGIVAVEALLGIWQYYIDLPWLQQQVRLGHEALPAALQTAKGLARFAGTDVFGTFGNPNSLAAFLIMGFWLIAGLCWNAGTFRQIAGALIAALLLWALVLTHSKGGLVACAVGAWFFAAQRINLATPRLKGAMSLATAVLVLAMIAVLVVGYSGKFDLILGPSLTERFGYWKAAFAMFAEHPLDGVGLAGFSENFSFFKIALGKETREPHNDYIQLLVELGVLGPVLYLSMWYLLLRDNPSAAAPTSNDSTRRTEWSALIGGLLAFVLLYVAFQSFGSSEIVHAFDGTLTSHALASIVLTLLLPAVFVMILCVFRGTERDPLSLWHGFRAAAGAVLVHELIDFDFRAQIVIGSLLFLGGMMYAQRIPTQEQAIAPRSITPKLALPLLAIIVAPIAFWIPMTSGLARESAEARDNEARELLREKKADPNDPASRHEAVDKFKKLRRECVDFRREAVSAAPFDGNAWIDLAVALQAYQAADRSLRLDPEILSALQNGERLRPLASYPKIVLGDYHFRQAMRLLRSGASPEKEFQLAHDCYLRGAQRYPFAPGFRLLVGDSLLMQGQLAEAATEYLEAFRTDMQIDDVNVRLSSIFTDGYAAALPRHGFEKEIHDEVSRQLIKQGKPNFVAALEIRRMVALTGIFHEARRSYALDTATLKSIRISLTQSTVRLDELLTRDAERGHAALFSALSLELEEKHPAKASAWKFASDLQNQSIASGKPGTPPQLFSILYGLYAKP